jgi:hypothetical protein
LHKAFFSSRVSFTSTRATGADLKVAVLTQSQLSLQQHLEIAPDILNCPAEDLEGELQPLIMAQAVPNPPSDKKRVKVYELRNNDWFDRGTGFCTAGFQTVCDFSPGWLFLIVVSKLVIATSGFSCCVLLTLSRAQNNVTRQEEPRVMVQSEDEPDRMLLETKICKEDGFQKQQGICLRCIQITLPRLTQSADTLIVWTEPSNSIDMALSFQESEGCAVIWFVLASSAIYNASAKFPC